MKVYVQKESKASCVCMCEKLGVGGEAELRIQAPVVGAPASVPATSKNLKRKRAAVDTPSGAAAEGAHTVTTRKKQAPVNAAVHVEAARDATLGR